MWLCRLYATFILFNSDNLPEALVSSAHNDSVLTAPLSENSDSNDSLSSQPTEQPTASATVMPIFSGIVNSEGNSFYCLGEDFQNIEHVRVSEGINGQGHQTRQNSGWGCRFDKGGVTKNFEIFTR